MRRKNHAEHANHNEKTCNYLKKHVQYSDWVIITAFYAAMHYVRHLMVPQVINETECNDFEKIFLLKKSIGEGRHGFQSSWVAINHAGISVEYNRLYEMSEFARYHNYEFTREESRRAFGYLEVIKEYVKEEKPF